MPELRPYVAARRGEQDFSSPRLWHIPVSLAHRRPRRRRIVANDGTTRDEVDVTEPGGDEAEMRKRLAALSDDLSRRKGPETGPQPGETPSASGVGQAISLGTRVVSEFVAAVVVGAVIGWQLDRWWGSSPAALIVFVALGTAAGFWNVYRVAMKTGAK
jgi:ATP synthase protein I